MAQALPKPASGGRPLKVVLARPRGFCAGVERAIDIVERALDCYGPPIYVRHEIVHNKRVVGDLRAKGAIFVDEIADIPRGAVAIFSAHGVARAVVAEARERALQVIDATCPLVSKVHVEGRRYAAQGYEVVLIGHAGHPEVEGTLGQIDGHVELITTVEDAARLRPRDPEKVAYVTQTTLSVDDTREIIATLKARFPRIVGPDVKDICYATQNRQSAVRALAALVDAILVVGSRNSSNSNRLREIGSQEGVLCALIEDADALDIRSLEAVKSLGITAGASAPEELVQGVLRLLETHFEVTLEDLPGPEENMRFKLPAALARASSVGVS